MGVAQYGSYFVTLNVFTASNRSKFYILFVDYTKIVLGDAYILWQTSCHQRRSCTEIASKY